MIHVVLYGSALDTAIRQAMVDDLAKRFAIRYQDRRSIRDFGKNPELLLVDTENLASLDAEPAILIMKTDAVPLSLTHCPRPVPTIANSENAEQLAALAKLSIPVITCGMRPKDSVTFSSCGDERVVASLGRTIRTVSGDELEPLEIPFHDCFGMEGYPLLAYAALRMLLGDVPHV